MFRRVPQLPDHIIIYLISACLNGRKQTASGNNGSQIILTDSMLLNALKNKIFSEFILIYQRVIFCNFLRAVRNTLNK